MRLPSSLNSVLHGTRMVFECSLQPFSIGDSFGRSPLTRIVIISSSPITSVNTMGTLASWPSLWSSAEVRAPDRVGALSLEGRTGFGTAVLGAVGADAVWSECVLVAQP